MRGKEGGKQMKTVRHEMGIARSKKNLCVHQIHAEIAQRNKEIGMDARMKGGPHNERHSVLSMVKSVKVLNDPQEIAEMIGSHRWIGLEASYSNGRLLMLLGNIG